MAVWRLNYTFELMGTNYMADIVHSSLLTNEEKARYKIQKNTFLVHLFTTAECLSFELFTDDGLQWKTLPGMDEQIAGVIGSEIDNQSM